MKPLISMLKIRMIACLFLFGCQTIKTADNKHFTYIEGSYQSWFVNDQERGTNILIKLKNVKDNIKFDSIIFRGRQVPVFRVQDGAITMLTAVQPAKSSVFQNQAKSSSDSDCLIYTVAGMRTKYRLPDIRRENMKYIKPLQ